LREHETKSEKVILLLKFMAEVFNVVDPKLFQPFSVKYRPTLFRNK
jgi:hypothetical protein